MHKTTCLYASSWTSFQAFCHQQGGVQWEERTGGTLLGFSSFIMFVFANNTSILNPNTLITFHRKTLEVTTSPLQPSLEGITFLKIP